MFRLIPVVLLVCATAAAAPVQFASFTSWQTAASPDHLLDFSGIALNGSGFQFLGNPAATLPGVTVTAVGPLSPTNSGDVFVLSDFYPGFQVSDGPYLQVESTLTRLTFSRPVDAIGFRLANNFANPFGIYLVVDGMEYGAQYAGPSFLGLILDQPLQSILIRSTDTLQIDDLAWRASAVPEPASAVLALLALIGLALGRVRREENRADL